jgi:hypothetical protein
VILQQRDVIFSVASHCTALSGSTAQAQQSKHGTAPHNRAGTSQQAHHSKRQQSTSKAANGI